MGLNTHSAILHKTHGQRPIVGTYTNHAFEPIEDGTTTSVQWDAKHRSHHPGLLGRMESTPSAAEVSHEDDNMLSVKEHHETLSEIHHTKTVSPKELGDAIKTAPVSNSSEEKSPPVEFDTVHPSVMSGRIKSTKDALQALPDETHSELKQTANEHLTDVAHSISKVQLLKAEHVKHKLDVQNATKNMKTAQEDAMQSHEELDKTKEAAKSGKVSLKTVRLAAKSAAAKTEKALKSAATVITKKKDLDMKTADLHAEKAKAAASAEAAVTTTHVAATTTTGPSKANMDKVADHTLRSLKPILPAPVPKTYSVKQDCDFLQDAVILSDLKPMRSVHTNEIECIGFGSYNEDGGPKIGAVRCKMDPQTRTCPAKFDQNICHLTSLDMGNLEPHFKNIFTF